MLRKTMDERPDWQAIAEANGFVFHHVDGEIYWDERACWQFTLQEVEDEIEDPTTELYAMCLSLVDDACASQELMEKLAIPRSMWDLIANSWRSGEASLYGRFDFAYNGSGPAKMLEFNADTPTSVYETAFFQWRWLEDKIAAGELPAETDQFNRLHEALVERFGQMFTAGSLVHFSAVADHIEDRATVAYFEDVAGQAGLEPRFVGIDQVGIDESGQFVDPEGYQIGAIFKLYPWEDMMREEFAQQVAMSNTSFVEPAWKAILSNKAMLPLLWERHTGHRNLLPAAVAGSDAAKELAAQPHVTKPFFSREGADIELFDGAQHHKGPEQGYGEEGAIIQAYAPIARHSDNHAVIGSWVVGDDPAGMSIREDASPITRDLARFLPHIILG
ncbi:glutathionylspermidine synthase family protein [Erythrobacter sp. F6033]|uniref:glutathionylspermidine synthase family protein n=1 Tax=Erythrobacter sp. F6033 TaxID=2926401 RepID=UPI001FF5FA66|nr:glutathionylspermidine synthase family protein [Erythrobacter sp. F6033]MCK0128852.1 glutathionylspermidine synthase family protein [Erythrobacter sp. F6033]